MNERRGLIVQGIASNGLIGRGEIAPLAGFSRESLFDCVGAAQKYRRMLESSTISDSPEDFATFIGAMTDAPPTVVFGFELMLADLAAQIAGKQLALWLRPGASDSVAINAVLAGGDIEAQTVDKLESGYTTFKLKIGAASLDDDLRRIAKVRHVIGRSAKLRLDANRAYDYDSASRMFAMLDDLDIEYIEEPLKHPSTNDLRNLRFQTGIPIAVDETLLDWHSESGNRVLSLSQDQLAAFDIAICKPALTGSIARTLKSAERLLQCGKNIVLTSSLDTGIGVSAALHLACALRIESACGFDTMGIFRNQFASPLPVAHAGRLALLEGLGLGLQTDLDGVAAGELRKINVR